ncbi:hypothetical protein K490DRAFT_66700 [Saccharata proteae CBS 121410]|uniref:C3H1-type domain-containing protein n=1 Tax=Saccharata proteae CBS 121410 TaxID=1314787 RepID=A0A9P4LXW5_9PEZI|nr:hypothetical protein K490DRAFT_66700 [Saccharata proteae CBS 121410]
MATERGRSRRYADRSEKTQLPPGADRQRTYDRSRSPARSQSPYARARRYRDRSSYSYSVRSCQEKPQMPGDTNRAMSWRKANERRSYNAERSASEQRAVSDPTPSRRRAAERERHSHNKASSHHRRSYEHEDRIKLEDEEDIKPQRGERVKPKNFAKPLTCFYWYHNGRCQKSDEDCYYAHYDTGNLASAPVALSSNVIVAGRSAETALDKLAENRASLANMTETEVQAAIKRREEALNAREVSIQRRLDELGLRGASLNKLADQVAAQESELAAQEANLAARQTNLTARETDLAAQETSFNDYRKNQEATIAAREYSVSQAIEQLAQREEALNHPYVRHHRLIRAAVDQRSEIYRSHFNRMAHILNDPDTDREAAIAIILGMLNEDSLRNIERSQADNEALGLRRSSLVASTLN